jgi:eukaryotic-like serine/threonine-protein kinase
MTPQVPTTDPYPRRFGRFILVGPLARGGMGELHLAVTGETDFQKICVVKQILSHLSFPEVIQRFVDEARVVVKLSHGNLVPVLESGSVDGRYFLAMEYVEGQNLRTVWNTLTDRDERLPLNLALYLIKELCRGLAYVHDFGDLGLVHRDVSPPNVLVSYSGEIKLADFGLASSSIKVQKTSPGVLVGKLAYMAPEHARGEDVDARADIYSAGIMLWELITGVRLFPTTETQAEQLDQVMNPDVKPPSSVAKDLPASLDLIAWRALAADPNERYPDAETMRKEVATALAKLDPTTDASTMQAFLNKLYGKNIDRQRQSLQLLLEEMKPKVEELVEVERRETADPRPRATLPGVVAPEEHARNEDGDDDRPLEPNDVLDGKYRIIGLLGEGGMGRVYRALHLGIHREVALKLLMPGLSEMADVVQRFRREARTASRIGHPNIVEILDSGTTSDGQEYFAMEYLEGVDVADVLAAERRLPLERVLPIAIQICDAMGAAHEAGVIHRDLKPENIFLIPKEDSPDFVKLVDFGVAKFANEEGDLTLPGLVMGTPEYMAPEQAEERGYDLRVDIYALGVLLYEMLTGRVPHQGASYNEIRLRKNSDVVAPAGESVPDLPPELDALLLQALEVDPDARPQTMGQLGYELRKLHKGRAAAVASMLNISGAPGIGFAVDDPQRGEQSLQQTAQLRALPQERSRRGLYLALGGGVAALALAALIWTLSGRSPEPRPAGAGDETAQSKRRAPDAAPTLGAEPHPTRLQRETQRKARAQKKPRPKTAPPKKPQRLEGTMDPFKEQR